MEPFSVFWICLLLASLIFNLELFLKLKKTNKQPRYIGDAREIVHDLTSGPAVVEIRRIDPTSIFVRSPR